MTVALPPWLLSATLQGSAAIVLVWILAPPLRRMAGARAAYLLWAVVLLRLLVPGLPSSPIRWPAPALSPIGAPVAGAAGFHVSVSAQNATVPAGALAAPRETMPSSEPLAILWLAGAGTILGLSIFRSVRASRLARRARDVSDNPALREILRTLPMDVARLRIRETRELKSPAICGLLHPIILLPVGWENQLTARELECVLLHEVGHLKRGDLFWRWAFLIARSVHWFNPLVWMAERSARLQQEMACDEWVLRGKNSPAVGVYGETLLVSARRLGGATFAFPIQAEMAESKAGLKRRIRHLAGIRRHGWNAIAACLLIAGILLVLTGPARSSSGSHAAEPVDKKSQVEATPAPGAAAHSPAPSSGRATQVIIESKFVELPSEMAAKLLGPSGGAEAMGVQAIYGEEQYERILRGLDGAQGVNLMSAPRVTFRFGQHATISIVREFRYPTRFDPPKILSPTLVVPATPAGFETRNVGVELEVSAAGEKGTGMDLVVTPAITEFLGFVDYGGSRGAKPNLDGDALADTFNPPNADGTGQVINQPIFSTRRITTQISLDSGQTALIGGIKADGLLAPVDKFPFAKSATTAGQSNLSLYIFVTATLINNLGKPAMVTPAPSPASADSADSAPYGIPVPGKPGFVKSPYDPDAGFVDVRGYKSGEEVKDPYSKKTIKVP